MKISRRTVSPTILAVFCVTTAHAQQTSSDRIPEPPAALTGSVVGHVVYAETQLPARFAEVILVHKPTDAELEPLEENPAPPHREARRPGIKSMQVVSVSRRSGMDGSFRVDGVPAGDYLLVARIPGYLTPGAQARGVALTKQIASLPAVHVSVGQVASSDLILHRGGVLGGQVRFADGSSAIGVEVTVQPAKFRSIDSADVSSYLPLQSAEQENFGVPKINQTDDEGRYRITGLFPGKYLITASIETDQGAANFSVGDRNSVSSIGDSGRPQPMTVYEPGVFRRKDAKVFEIRVDEQRLDADIKVDPSDLHTVHGKLIAGEDRHAPKQASVQLFDPGADGAGEMAHFAQSAPDGSFQIYDVPPGSYTVQVIFATDQDLSKLADEAQQDGVGVVTSVRSLTQVYKSGKVPVIVGEHDITLEDIVLTPVKPGSKELFPPPQWRR